MIEKIGITNFKCFENIDLNLGALNVFSGINGMGKSTVIQSILLLKQSEQQSYLPNNICLNGDYVSLGMAQDILYEHADEEYIMFQLLESGSIFNIRVKYVQDLDVLKIDCAEDYHKFALFREPFEYLSAERKGPQVIYPKSSFYVDSKSQLGINGEYTVHYLSKYQDKSVIDLNGRKESLKEAVQFWLNEISPDVKLDVSEIENTDLAKLGFYYLDKTKSRTFRPTNVGFGISYVLPVVVALLKAEKGNILIIENPEAHLHPKGQRKMGELISHCAANGVQIFLETHSDHVLNGIRIAVKKQILKEKQAKLFYFSKKLDGNKIIHMVECPQICSDGRLDYWPDGFFDEWEKALDEII